MKTHQVTKKKQRRPGSTPSAGNWGGKKKKKGGEIGGRKVDGGDGPRRWKALCVSRTSTQHSSGIVKKKRWWQRREEKESPGTVWSTMKARRGKGGTWGTCCAQGPQTYRGGTTSMAEEKGRGSSRGKPRAGKIRVQAP